MKPKCEADTALITQRSQVQILPPLQVSGSESTDSEPESIGEPPGYPPSDFYNMELNQVRGYWNYLQDIQP